MSRMAVPTMDVVRFKEDDIIVASGGSHPDQPLPPEIETIILANFNDGEIGNATMDGDPVSTFVRSLQRTHGSLNVYFKYNGSEAVRAIDLLNNEENGMLRDGTYIESQEGDNVVWTWIHQ